MRIPCPHCGEQIVVKGLGRKPLNHTVNFVYDTLRACCSVTPAAKELGCSRGYIYKVLKDHGMKARELLKKGVALK